jgi:predicted O-methyltransferase YrrM
VLTLARPARDAEARRIRTWIWGRLPRVPIDLAFPGIEAVNVTIHRTFDRVTGYSVDANEVLCICAIERFIRASRIIEIGTYDGNTALNLAANSDEGGTVVTVDLPAAIRNAEARSGTTRSDKIRPVGGQFVNSSYASAITQVYADSKELNWSELGGSFDLVFIDGNHDFDYVSADTENALRYLNPGGVVIWHDYGAFRDVSHVVDQVAVTRTVYAVRGTRLAVMRA